MYSSIFLRVIVPAFCILLLLPVLIDTDYGLHAQDKLSKDELQFRVDHYQDLLSAHLDDRSLSAPTPIPTELQEKTQHGRFSGAENMTLISRWAEGPSEAVVVQDGLAYFGVGGYLRIADVTNPANPIVVGEALMPSLILGVAIDDGYLFVAAAYEGLRILDVSDPTSPVEVSHFEITGSTYDVAVSGKYAYVPDGFGLRVLDVSDRFAPTQVGFVSTIGSAIDVTVAGEFAYISDVFSGLIVVDISDPASPFEVGSYLPFPFGFFEQAVVQGELAYVADWLGLRIVDITNPSNPQEIGFFDSQGYPFFSVAVSGDFAYAADGTGLRIIDISNPNSPFLTTVIDGAHFGDIYYDVVVDGSTLYHSDSIEGLRIFDLADPSAPVGISTLDAEGVTYAAAIQDGLAYLATGNTGLSILDVSDHQNPVELGSFDTGFASLGITVDGDYAYLADALEGLRIIDVTDPMSPIEVGSLVSLDWVYDVDVRGNYAYLANGGYGLGVIDISDKTNPVEVGRFFAQWRCDGFDFPLSRSIVVKGQYAYTADTQCGLRILNISDPTNPIDTGIFLTTGLASGVDVREGIAYLADGVNGLRIIDVSNPFLPSEIATFNTDHAAQNVVVDGSFAYVVDEWEGVRMIDISDPATPTEVGFLDTGYWARGVAVSGAIVYVSDVFDGLYLVRNDIYEPVNPVTSLSSNSGDGNFVLTMDLANSSESSLTVDIWSELSGPGGQTALFTLQDRTFAGRAALSKNKNVSIPFEETGEYIVRVNTGVFPNQVLASDRQVYTKTTNNSTSAGAAHELFGIPNTTTLLSNFPNPFNPSTQIRFGLQQNERVTIKIFNTLGQQVETLVDENLDAGFHTVTWGGADALEHQASSGVYYVTMQAGTIFESQRILFIK